MFFEEGSSLRRIFGICYFAFLSAVCVLSVAYIYICMQRVERSS